MTDEEMNEKLHNCCFEGCLIAAEFLIRDLHDYEPDAISYPACEAHVGQLMGTRSHKTVEETEWRITLAQ